MNTFTRIRIGVIAIMMVAIIAVMSASPAHSATEADRAWWRSLTQSQRNLAITYRAGSDLWRYVGVSCKVWVRNVVFDASRGVVSIPSTLPDAYGWYWDYSKYVVGMSGGIRAVKPGWIVQMNWRLNDGTTTPHTAIVTQVTSSGVYFIESNWCLNNCEIVRSRFVSFTDFEAHAYLYTVYYIIG